MELTPDGVSALGFLPDEEGREHLDLPHDELVEKVRELEEEIKRVKDRFNDFRDRTRDKIRELEEET